MNPIYLSLIPATWLVFRLGAEYGKRRMLQTVETFAKNELRTMRAKRAASLCLTQSDVATGTPIAAELARQLGIDLAALSGATK